MNLNVNGRVLKRTALAVVLAAMAGTSYAQSTAGDIIGTASSADKIQVKSLASGATRETTVSSDGRFRLSQLPTGTYEVISYSGGTQVGSTRVNVVAGQTTTATFAAGNATSLETVNVRATGTAPIDLSSVETRTTFTAEQLNSLPVGRDVTSVSLLTPGTVASSGYFGPASFGGASAAENSYYVNGFNVTNLYDSLSFSEIPYQAIDQLDVQTGGYGAKYGLSTGGVTSVNVKRGTNEWKGGFSWTGAPDWGRSKIPNSHRNDGQIFRDYSSSASSSNVYSAWAGGPLIEDKLFVFAMGQFSNSKSTTYGSRSEYSNASVGGTSYDYEVKTPYWLLKVDWYLNENNQLEYTGFDNSNRYTYDYYNNVYNVADERSNRTTYKGQLVGKRGGQTDIFKWTSYLTDNLTASLQYGQMRNQASEFTIDPKGVMSSYNGDVHSPDGACPYVVYNGTVIGCSVASQVDLMGGKNERKGGKLDFEWQLGDHRVAFGYGNEKWDSRQGTAYSAGAYWSINSASKTAVRTNYRTGGSVRIEQNSWYLQDNWQVTDNFMLYLGVRNDSFKNKNSDNITFVKQDNIWQPRLGFSWDTTGDGRSKLFGSLGRYSLPIAANVALRAASASYYTADYYTYLGSYDPVSGKPNVAPTPYRSEVYNGENGTLPDPHAVASRGLKPFTQDEAILGYQYQLSSANDFLNDWTVGIKATYRKLHNVIDDTCDSRSIYNAAKAAGYDLSGWDSEWAVPGNLPGCYLFNPGKDLNLSLDVDGDGKPDSISVPGSQLGPKAERTYKALTLSADKRTDRWYASLSYTWSKLDGNYEGLVKSSNGQDDTGTTSDFDFPEIMYGANGYLFNDHRHSIKLFGSYDFTPEWQLGLNIQAQSGSPISCFGGGFDGDEGTFGTEYGYGAAFHYCNGELSPQGKSGRTPWTVNVSPSLTYRPNWLSGLSIQASVLNAFNNIKPVQVYEVTENVDYGRVYNDYGVGKYYTTPRYVRFQVQYDW
ncbi:TonB-dependent receptor [Stenotrophomonas sp. CC120222-04]|uniref:TonB-dependent receptor n=1 Tax=Stenotrophomonas sp. CC120222-04 TaxID=1378088 RepID=UPI000B71BBF0|nr:TonB-dependent receptor [Stenotrophomonas sp. CC120222-04]SNT81167.1 Outer membrane receptor for ferrienterochelin and colicins [Stenotrophomonas sp. CC120222-04]